MQKSTNSLPTQSHVSDHNLAKLLNLEIHPAITFSRKSCCTHTNALSTIGNCTCNFCSLLFKIFNFQKKQKNLLSRASVRNFVGKDFLSIFESTLLLFIKSRNRKFSNIEYAKRFVDNKLRCEYDCSISGMHGVNSEKPYHYDCWGVCNNVEHLFECFSISDSSRGKHFPVRGSNLYWHTTCAACGASCAFASPRESIVLSLFFHFLDVLYDGKRYYLQIKGTTYKNHCSRDIAQLICLSLGGALTYAGIEIAYEEPPFVSIGTDVFLEDHGEFFVDIAGSYCKRYPKDAIVDSSDECEHDFYLTSSEGSQLRLSKPFMRLLMMLLTCDGYLNGFKHGAQRILAPEASGLINVGGLKGVNLRCNLKFTTFHEAFYTGPLRDDITHPQMNQIDLINLLNANTEITVAEDPNCVIHVENCAAQMSSEETEYEEENPDSDIDDDERTMLERRVKDFLEDDEPLLEVGQKFSRAQGRGLGDLARRAGGLLKSVTKCVAKLHAVWDWPLDTALKGINGVGEWLEHNEKHVDKKVWSCVMCPEIQKKTEEAFADQNKILEMLMASVKRLSETFDAFSEMNKSNLEEIEKKLKDLESRPIGSGDSSGTSKHTQEQLNDFFKHVVDLTKRVNELESNVSKKTKKKPSFPSPADNSLVGEQMSIPRNPINPPQPIVRYGPRGVVLASKQSGDAITRTKFEGGDQTSESVPTSHIESSGNNEIHNAILANIYLGSFDWNVSDGEGKLLKSYAMPDAIWKQNERMRNIATYFQYYTCKGLEFTITTTSIGMQGGTLIASWDSMSCATRQQIDTALQLSNLPSVFIHASESKEVRFQIESPSIQHMMCLSGSEASIGILGSLKISIINGLNANSETSQKVSMNVWVRFLNPKMSFYTMAHDVVSAHAGSFENIKGVSSMEAVVAVGKWSTTSSTNLMELTVHPTACHISRGLVTQTTLSVISHLFNRWKGSLVFKFIFAASMFVRGKVLISAVPVSFKREKMSISQITSFPHIVCDLSTETREFELTVPYISIGNNSLVCRDSLYDISSYNSELVVSRVHVVILDPLVMTANASNTISFCVTLRPGSDFELLDYAGVKAEYVNRTLAQGMFSSLKSSGLVGSGFDKWIERESVLHKVILDNSEKNALFVMVAPALRRNPPCITALSWLSQIFVEWSGSLIYTFRAHSHERKFSPMVRIWHDSNASTKEDGVECNFVSDVDPPAGAIVRYWKPIENAEFEMTVPFKARTSKLLLPKARILPTRNDWLHYYNGMLVVDLEGPKAMKIDISIRAGPDFEMYEQTVAPRCGKVASSFTQLSYEDKLKGITEFPLNITRLSGPVNKATITPITFKPVDSVANNKDMTPPVEPRNKRGKDLGPKVGDTNVDDQGRPIWFNGTSWAYVNDSDEDSDAEAQMNCIGCVRTVQETVDVMNTLKENETVAKVAKIVNKVEEVCDDTDKNLPGLLEKLKFLLPLLNRVEKFSGSVEEKLDHFTEMKDKIMKVIRGFFADSLPGIFSKAVLNDEITWVTILSVIGGIALLWYSTSRRKFAKRLKIFLLIIWSPFLFHKVWKLGKWILKFVEENFQTKHDDETCRKHSMVGAFEDAKESFSNIADWFSGNWVNAAQSLLTILGVVASLIMWGTIPDGKNLTSFSAKFKEVGDKGRTFTNIFSGFGSIVKMCSEWSSKLVAWTLGVASDKLPKADSDLEKLVKFDIRVWVEGVREMALLENKYQDFGSENYISKVRHLYDQSQRIQRAIMDGVKMDVSLGLIIKECKDKCTELLNGTYSFKGMKQTRIDPIHICMIGAPGVGKSATAHVVINNLLDYMNEPEVDRIYTRCCADAYWSNYHHEPCILYDDLGAVNSKIKMSDYAEIMGVKTNDPFSVPMAAVEDKGKHCTSKYVFSCTNVLELDDTGDVVTKSAYYRRRNVLVRVERDPEIPMNPEVPTAGLLFTVLGHTLEGNNGNRVHFHLKEEWNEDFLRNVNTEGWIFDRVEFKTFLQFLCTYTKAYMSNQENLLKGVNRYRIDPFETEETVAQSGDFALNLMTLKDMIARFESLGYTGKTLRNLLGKDVVSPKKWNTNKALSFMDLMKTACGCNEGKVCNIDFYLNVMEDSLDLKKDKPQHFFVLNRVSAMPEDTTVNVLRTDFESINPVAFLLTLISYYRFSYDRGMCPFHLLNRERAACKENAKDASLDCEDEIPEKPEVCTLEHDVLIWPGVEKLYPTFTKKYGFVRIFDGEKSVRFTPRKPKKLDFSGGDKETWEFIWINGIETRCDLKSILDRDTHIIFDGLLNNVTNFGSRESFSDEFKGVCNQAKEIFGEGRDYWMFLLYSFVKHSNDNYEFRKESEKQFKKEQFLRAIGKLDEVENRTIAGLSSSAKMALAIGGGIVASGVLIGLIVSMKTLFSSITSGEEVTEEAESEGSSAGASGMFKTEHIVRGRMKPKVVVTTMEPQASSAGASGMFKTEHVVSGRRKPKVTQARAESGFGVTYDDTDLRKALSNERRKAKRVQFSKAISHASGIKASSTIVDAIDEWQRTVLNKGVAMSTDKLHAKGIMKRIKNANSEPQGVMCADTNEFIQDAEVLETLKKLLEKDEVSLEELINNGTTERVKKHASVGEFGLVKDRNLAELITTHVSKMSCMLIIRTADKYMTCNILRLKSTFVLMPAHYFELLVDAENVWFVCPNKIVEVAFNPTACALVSTLQDLLIWNLGNTVPPSVDYMKHIPTEADWEHYNTSQGVLSLTSYRSEMTMQITNNLDSIELVTLDAVVPSGTYEMLGSTHTVVKGLRYRVHCMVGFCGAAVCKADTKSVRKIIGMHVAGAKNKGVGYAEALIFEDLERAIGKLSEKNKPMKDVKAKTDEDADIDKCEKQSPLIEGKGNLGTICVVARTALPNLPSKTTVCESPIHGMIGEIKSEPAILSKWDHRLGEKRGHWDPVMEGVKKYGTPIKSFKEEEICVVEDHLKQKFQNFDNSLKKRSVNGVEVGINGIEGSDFWAPMEMKTSAGYPYVLKKPAGATGKAWLFDEDGNYASGRLRYKLKDNDFKISFESMWKDIKDGIAPRIITMECPKDERRKLAKIYTKPATRTFTILPPEINLLFRMYFGDFSAMVMETRAAHFSQVGINPETLEWSELMNNFKKIGNRGFAGDYAKFDGIGSPCIYHSIVNVVNAWYNDGFENARARHCLISAIVHRYGIAGELLMLYSQGMPSGFSMTVIFNSFVNYYYMALAWQSIVGRSSLSPQVDLQSFDYYTKLIVYGDDNVVAVDDAFLEVYNLRTVASFLSEYGITYTDDAKNPIHLSEPHVDITSVTFLKRSFVKIEKSGILWKAPLDKVSIEERCHWIRQCEDHEEALYQNIDSALYEASIHDEAYFLDLKGRLDEALERVVLPKTTHTFKSEQARWWGNISNFAVSSMDLNTLAELSKKNSIDLGFKLRHVILKKDLTLQEVLKRAAKVPAAKYIP